MINIIITILGVLLITVSWLDVKDNDLAENITKSETQTKEKS